jgi:Ser/Thr protein kinase RdoA (MazF antagonist)
VGDAEAAIQRALGARIERRIPAPWGSKNRTTVVDLSDGRRVVAQVYADPGIAAVRLKAALLLGEPLAQRGVRVPRVLAQDQAAGPAWAVFESLPGAPGYVACGDDLSSVDFPAVASDMGSVLRHFADLDSDRFDLPRLWTDPFALALAAERWLSDIEAYLSAVDAMATRAIIDSVPGLLANRRQVVCHGDFGPQNVLVQGGHVTGLLDLEDARVGDSLLDVAWWAWLVRAHTPSAFTRSWSGFLDASGIDRSQESFEDRVLALIVLRLLETADAYLRSAPEKYPSWAARLARTLRWRGRSLS